MLTKVTKLENSEAELFVELGKEELQSYLKKTGEQLSGMVKIDGFRAGKAPLNALRNKIGDQKILKEALELAVTGSLAKALEKEKLEIINSSELKISENTPDSLKYSIKLQLFPEVRLGNYKNLNVAKKEIEVEEKEIENAITLLLKSRTSFEDTDGPALKEHHLEIDFEVTENGRLVEGGKSENHPLILGKGNFIPGFEEQLEGLNKGGTKKFSLQVPEDYYQKGIAGKKLDFKVAVKSIKAGRIPELTADFVKRLGNFGSVEDLKKNITESLRAEKERKEKERFRLEILEKINKNSEIAMPVKLVEEQLDSMIANFDQSLHERGMELGLYLAHLKKTQDDLRKEWYKQAEDQIRRGLIMREIGKKEKISIDAREVQEAANSLMTQYMLNRGGDNFSLEAGTGGQQIDPERIKQKTEEMLLNEKIWDFLEKNS